MMQGKWLDANDINVRFEDNDKLVEVANALSRVGVEDFNDVDFPGLVELAKRSMKSKKEKSDFDKTIETGKTYEKKKREGVDTTPEEDKAYAKALKDMKRTIERAIRMLNSSASTVTEFADYQGKTYEQCLNIIEKDIKLGAEFFEMFGVNVSFVKGIKSKLPLPTLDLIVERTIHGDSANNVANSSLGIVADSPELWREILSTRTMRRKLNSNKCKRILVVAGGLGTEIDVLVELYGIDILDKIVYNEKYTTFCNRIKRKYPQLTLMQGNFLELEFNMKFDVIVGNPPYEGKKQTHQKFFNKAYELLEEHGTMAFIQPATPYMNKKDPRSHENKMREIIMNNEVSVTFHTNKIFDVADVNGVLAETVLTKKKNNNPINSVKYTNGSLYENCSLSDINMLEIDPSVYKSIRLKYLNYIEKCGSLYDKQYYNLGNPKPNVIKLQKIRGHLDNPDFFTFLSNNSDLLSSDISEPNDFGIELNSNDEMNNCYLYLKGYISRFGLALSKFNTNNHMGEFKTVPLIDFSVVYDEDMIRKEIGITDDEYNLIKNTLGNYHNVQ
jgi:hypothetical protein